MKKQIIISRFYSEGAAEDFANSKAKEGYELVNVAIDFSRTATTAYVVSMTLPTNPNTGKING